MWSQRLLEALAARMQYMARCFWALEKEEITEHLCQIEEHDVRGRLAVTMKSLRHEDLVRVSVTLWATWYARRKAVHENIYQSPLSTHQFVANFVASL